jgi:hypothetical protein
MNKGSSSLGIPIFAIDLFLGADSPLFKLTVQVVFGISDLRDRLSIVIETCGSAPLLPHQRGGPTKLSNHRPGKYHTYSPKGKIDRHCYHQRSVG